MMYRIIRRAVTRLLQKYRLHYPTVLVGPLFAVGAASKWVDLRWETKVVFPLA